MNIDKIRLQCNVDEGCGEWVDFSPNEVHITLDTQDDRYVLQAQCPWCSHNMYVTRLAFPEETVRP